jgi:hypothetical protein
LFLMDRAVTRRHTHTTPHTTHHTYTHGTRHARHKIHMLIICSIDCRGGAPCCW